MTPEPQPQPQSAITSTSVLLDSHGGGGPKSKPAIPDHEVIRCIGAGAYGEVWLARNVLGTYRAIKVVYRKSFRDERSYEREFRGIQQFEPVSRGNERLLHILQAGRNDEAGYYYYVMELADDATPPIATELTRLASPNSRERSLVPPAAATESYVPKTLASEIQRRGRLSPAECVQLGINLTLALGHLHRQNLIHRDIKPANIIFVQGIPKLADIGLVTTFDDTCSFVGTEGFIAPEGPTSPRADLFSLGKVLYETSTGKDRKDFPEPPTGLGENDDQDLIELNAVVLKACAVDLRERYQSAEDFHADLALLNSGRSVRWKRVVEKRLAFARRAGVVVAIIAALATSGYVFQRYQTREAKRLQQVAEELVSRMQMQNAENLFERGDSSLALAHLAQVLRRDPNNRLAAERIRAALTQRNFPKLLTKPMLHEANLYLRHTQVPARLSPDGTKILSVSSDHKVHLWNAANSEETIPPLRYSEPVTAVDFSPDSSRALVASGDRTVLLFDVQTGAPVFPAFQHDRTVLSAAFAPTGQFIATASLDTKARIFSAETGRLLHLLPHESGVNAVVFSPDSQSIATASEDATVRVWDVQSGGLKHRWKQLGPVRFVRFSPDGRWIAAGVLDSKDADPNLDWMVQLHENASGNRVGRPLIHQRVYSIAFSPDSQRLVVGDGANVARVWQISSSEELFRLPHSAMVYAAEFSPDGRQILTASVDHTARLWDASTGAALAEPMLHDGRVLHAEFSRDGERVLTAGWEDKALKLWDVRSIAPVPRTFAHPGDVNVVFFDPAGRHILTTTRASISTANNINRARDDQESLMVWDVAGWQPRFASTFPKEMVIAAAQFSAGEAKALVLKKGASEARLWDFTQESMAGDLIRHEQRISCARFSTDGLKFATGSIDGTARIWDVRGRPLTPPLSHTGQVASVVFSPDGKKLVALVQNTATIWDANEGRRMAILSGHTARVWVARFSSQNDKVITASVDYSARIWSTSGALLATLQHDAPLEYAEFSPDGSMVVTAAGDRTARVWNAATGRQLAAPLQHKELVFMARFSPDGRQVVTASMDGTAQLWDAATGLKLSDSFRHDDWVVCANFSADGRRLATASFDRTAKVWELPCVGLPVPDWLAPLAEAVGGKRLNAEHVSESVSWTQFAELKARLSQSAATQPQFDWLSRVLARQPAM